MNANPTEKQMRELDAWVGNVLGDKPSRYYELVAEETGFVCDSDSERAAFDNIASQSPNEHSGKLIVREVVVWKRYTTDPAAAMQVLEKCAEKSPEQKLEIIKAGDEWLVQYFDDPVYETSQEQTLSLAICLIAKKLYNEPPTRTKP